MKNDPFAWADKALRESEEKAERARLDGISMMVNRPFVRSAPPVETFLIDIRGEVIKRRANAIAESDAAGLPRRSLHDIVREYDELDRRRLQGR